MELVESSATGPTQGVLAATPSKGATSYTFQLVPGRGTAVKVASAYPTVRMRGLLPDTVYIATVTVTTLTQRFTSGPKELRTPAKRCGQPGVLLLLVIGCRAPWLQLP